MSKQLAIPEITVFPSAIPTGEEDKVWYAWAMRLHEDETLQSEDHGDEFYSVGEALVHALSVFQDLVDRRRAYPAHREQEFRLTVKRA